MSLTKEVKVKMHKKTSLSQKAPDKIRLTVDVSPELNETLNTLASNSSTTKSDVMRRAITLVEDSFDTFDRNAEPLENQKRLDEIYKIYKDISKIQSRLQKNRLEIDTSSRNIDNMLNLLED